MKNHLKFIDNQEEVSEISAETSENLTGELENQRVKIANLVNIIESHS